MTALGSENAAHDLGVLTWPNAQDSLMSAVVVVPVGALEQHGPHLPLDTDVRLSAGLATRAARVVAASDPGVRVLVAPPVNYGFSPHHMHFAGTVTLDAQTFRGVVAAVARSLWRHGTRRILLLNGHGGNSSLLRLAVQELLFESGVRTVAADYWSFALDYIRDWRESSVGGISHACEMETSLMLALHPDLVRMDLAQDCVCSTSAAFLTNDLLAPSPVTTASHVDELSSNGVVGSPTVATAERGQELLDEIVERLARFLAEFAQWDVGLAQTSAS